MKKVKPEELLSYGVHLGHKKQRVHPRARKFIHKIESGVSIIDLFQTAERLETACTIAKSLGKSKKVLLLVGTKRVARDVIRDAGQKHNLPYVSQKWVGGLLTNFAEISKNVKRIKDMRSEQDEGTWKKLPKHEQVALEKKLNRIASIYDGVVSMTELPDALFIVDIKKEKNAIMEARRL
ncbi:MAG: 30S ribosomal protein S2, partial [Candidatus Paceibacterota bacterium]